MQFLAQNKAFFWVAVVLLLFGVLLSIENPLKYHLRAGMRSMASTAWAVAGGVGDLVDEIGGFSSRGALNAKIKMLEVEITRLESLSLYNDVLRSENATLRDMFSLREAHSEGIAAPVLSNPSISPFGTFVIGSGTEDGVLVGNYVLSAPRVVVGQVVEAGARTALVTIFSAPGHEVDVIVNDTRATYVGRGDGNGEIVVPRGVNIAVGDAAVLANHPFAVGIVGAVAQDPEASEIVILVRVPSNLPALSFVYVVPE